MTAVPNMLIKSSPEVWRLSQREAQSVLEESGEALLFAFQ